jgi:hypothetical protein
LKLIYDRRPVGHSVLVLGSHLEHVSKISFSHYCGFLDVRAASLTGEWASNLLVQLLLRLTSAVTLGLKSSRTHDYILLSHLRLPPSPTWRVRSPYSYPSGTGWPSYTPFTQKSKSKLSYDRRSVGQSVLVSGYHQGPWPIFLSPWIQLRVCYFREGGSVIYCCCWASPVQSLSGLSPAGLKTIPYCSNFLDSSNLEGQVPVYISPRYRMAQLYPRALGSLFVASHDSQRWKYSNPPAHGDSQK